MMGSRACASREAECRADLHHQAASEICPGPAAHSKREMMRCRTRKDASRLNFAVICRTGYNVLKADKTRRSLRPKKAAWFGNGPAAGRRRGVVAPHASPHSGGLRHSQILESRLWDP